MGMPWELPVGGRGGSSVQGKVCPGGGARRLGINGAGRSTLDRPIVQLRTVVQRLSKQPRRRSSEIGKRGLNRRACTNEVVSYHDFGLSSGSLIEPTAKLRKIVVITTPTTVCATSIAAAPSWSSSGAMLRPAEFNAIMTKLSRQTSGALNSVGVTASLFLSTK